MKSVKILRFLTIVAAVAAFTIGCVLLGRSTLSALTPAPISTTTLDVDGFGSVNVVRTDGRDARGLIILVADEHDADIRRQDGLALAKNGMIAVSFNFDAFRANLAKAPQEDECHYVSDDLKDLAQAVQRKLGLEHYLFPIIVGRGDGAAFAYAALAQAPANTLGGAIGIGFRPLLRTDRTYCFDQKLEAVDDSYYTLRPEPNLPAAWRAIGPESERQTIQSFQGTADNVEFLPASDDASVRTTLVESALRLHHTGESGHSSLPVSIIEPDGPVTGLAIVVSGDGGWRDIDKSIGEWLAHRGVAVIGLDSLRYFWSEKRADDVAADLAFLLDHYGAKFGTDRYALIGFSFGSDIMPDVWPALPKAVRDRVKLVSLMALGTNADFEITVGGFIGALSAESRPLIPLLHQLPLDRTQCIYGKEEAEDNLTSCTAPELGQAERVVLDGGHHFDGDYAKAAESIWRRFGSIDQAP